MEINLQCIKDISPKKEKELIELAFSVNNKDLLNKTKNKSLIFSGVNDQIMPLKVGKMLNCFLVNSSLVVTRGAHFNVFTKENLGDLDRFLAS